MPTIPPLPDQPRVELAITTGLSAGAKLRENRIFHLTPMGVEFTGEMTLEQWREGMRLLQMFEAAGTLWKVDFVAEGARRFGEETVQATFAELEFLQTDVQQIYALRTLDRGARRPELTPQHYWALAAHRLTAEKQREWADRAVEHKLSAAQLDKSIAAGRVMTKAELGNGSGRGSGIANPHGIRHAFDLWFKQTEESDPIDRWPRDRQEQLYEELAPVAKVVRDLEVALGKEAKI